MLFRLPATERLEALRKARKEMQDHVTATEEEVADLHRMLISKISFLRVKVPKRHRDAVAIGSGHYVVREGRVVCGKAGEYKSRCSPSNTITRHLFEKYADDSAGHGAVRSAEAQRKKKHGNDIGNS